MAVVVARTNTGSANGGQSTTSGTTVSCPVTADPGDLVLLVISADNLSANTPTIASVSKPAGEGASWAQLSAVPSPVATAAGGVVGYLWFIVPTTTWTAQSITVTLSGAVTAKCCNSCGFTGATGTLRGTVATATAAAGNPSVANSGTAPVAGDLVIGTIHGETNLHPAVDSDTLNGSWAIGCDVRTAAGGGAANVDASCQYKIVTADGAQTINASMGVDSGVSILALVPDAGGGGAIDETFPYAGGGFYPKLRRQWGRRRSGVLVPSYPQMEMAA